jgi:DNA-directed RNA polymerase specialized sigma24 family protein
MKRKGLNRLIHKAIDRLNYAVKELVSELYFNYTSVNKLSKKYPIPRSTIRYRRDKALAKLKEIVEKEVKN